MLAKEARHEKEGGQPLLGGLDVVVDRNFFGSQLQARACTLPAEGSALTWQLLIELRDRPRCQPAWTSGRHVPWCLHPRACHP